MITATVETKNYDRAIAGLRQALIASGQSSDASAIIKDEGRRLASEISAATGPKSRSKAAKEMGKDVARNFSVLTNNIKKKQQGDGAYKWAVAGPHFLYGIEPEKDLRGMDADLLAIHRERNRKPKEKKLILLGKRGKQKVYRVWAPIITKRGRAELLKKLMSKIGRKKASWASSAIAMGEKNVPDWVRRHTPSPKAITNLAGLSNPNNPSLLFGSRSAGVSKDRDKVRMLMAVRVKKILARISLIMNGYRQDIKQGAIPQKRGKESASVSS